MTRSGGAASVRGVRVGWLGWARLGVRTGSRERQPTLTRASAPASCKLPQASEAWPGSEGGSLALQNLPLWRKLRPDGFLTYSSHVCLRRLRKLAPGMLSAGATIAMTRQTHGESQRILSSLQVLAIRPRLASSK